MRYTVDLKNKSILLEYEKKEEKEVIGYQAALRKVYGPKGFTFVKNLIDESIIRTPYGNYVTGSGSYSPGYAIGTSSNNIKYETANGINITIEHDPSYDNVYSDLTMTDINETIAFEKEVKEQTELLRKLNETF